MTAGYQKLIKNEKGDAKIRVNDAFYLQNFKGIKNVGYYFDTEGKREGLCGDILGFDRYAAVLVKLQQMRDLPFFS